jgi:hypothetical protein
MSNALLGYVNNVLAGTLTAGSEETGLTVGNLQTQHGSAAYAWRTASGIKTSAAGAWFQCDSGSNSTTWRAFAVARTNLTTSATIRARVSNNSGMTSPTNDSGTVAAGVVASFGQAVVAPSAVQTGRYCRVDLNDSTNTDDFLSVALAYLGPCWQPGINYAPDSGYSFTRSRQVVRTRGGSTFVTPLYVERAWQLAFGAVTSAELWAQVAPAELAAFDGRNCLFVPDPAGTYINRETVLGPLETTDSIGHLTLDGNWRTWRARIVERL